MELIEIVLYISAYIKTIILLMIVVFYFRQKKAITSLENMKKIFSYFILLVILFMFVNVINTAAINHYGKELYTSKSIFQDSLQFRNTVNNDITNTRIDSLLGKKIDDRLMDSIYSENIKNEKISVLELLPYVKRTREMTEYNSKRIDSNKDNIYKTQTIIQQNSNK